MMKHQDLRTDEQKFDDLLSEGHSLNDIAYRLSWSVYRTRQHYRQVCAAMGELPDATA
jgi:DNA-binding NarL/FixJ family response regulator